MGQTPLMHLDHCLFFGFFSLYLTDIFKDLSLRMAVQISMARRLIHG